MGQWVSTPKEAESVLLTWKELLLKLPIDNDMISLGIKCPNRNLATVLSILAPEKLDLTISSSKPLLFTWISVDCQRHQVDRLEQIAQYVVGFSFSNSF